MTKKSTIPTADRTLIFTLNSGGRCSGTACTLRRNQGLDKLSLVGIPALRGVERASLRGRGEQGNIVMHNAFLSALYRIRTAGVTALITDTLIRTVPKPKLLCENCLLLSPLPP